MPREVSGLPASDNPGTGAARLAILDSIQKSCGSPLSEALSIQARHSAEFMKTSACKQGRIGAEFTKAMSV
jgi:hypothetical protein